MIACLPMYDWPEERAGIDALWSHLRDSLRDSGIASPDQLTRGEDLWALWEDPGLVLGQTCSLPYRERLARTAQVVGTLDYGLEGVQAGHYASALVVRADDPRAMLTEFAGATLALNGFDSQSGWVAAHAAARLAGIGFRRFHHTGAHRESARRVAEGVADIAAVDAVTWRLIQRHAPDLAGALRVLCLSPSSPSLPLITAKDQPADRIATAVARAIKTLPPKISDATGVIGFHPMHADDYMAVPTPPLPSQAQPVL